MLYVQCGTQNNSSSEERVRITLGAEGSPGDLVIELSTDPDFARLAPISKKQEKERGRDELVTRFFAYGDGLDSYRDRPAQFLFEYSKKMNQQFELKPDLMNTYRARFKSTMEFVRDHFPHGFRKKSTSNTTPRARFEAIAIGSYLALQEEPELGVSKPVPSVVPWLESPEFRSVTGSDGANVIAKLRARLDFVKERLLQ